MVESVYTAVRADSLYKTLHLAFKRLKEHFLSIGTTYFSIVTSFSPIHNFVAVWPNSKVCQVSAVFMAPVDHFRR